MTRTPAPARIYLDHAATTPLAPAARRALLTALDELPANPSSLHRDGQRARAAVEGARERVAAALGARPREVVFTGGATEADNHALRAVMRARPGARLVTSRLEHAAVLASARALEAEGHPVSWLEPDAHGAIVPEALAAALDAARAAGEAVALVALMAVNNETGVRTDIAAMSDLAHRAGALMFCDAVQAFGFEPLEVDALGVDLLAVSGHKVGGPKGVGALFVRSGLELAPLLHGGEQEGGLRAGTHNTAAIAGFGAAAEAAADWRERARRVGALRDRLEAHLRALPGVEVNGAGAPRGPKHCNARFHGVDGELLLMALDRAGVSASAGSACAAGSLEPSHVLLAMGLSPAAAKASVRFSLGEGLDEALVDAAAARIDAALERCRALR